MFEKNSKRFLSSNPQHDSSISWYLEVPEPIDDRIYLDTGLIIRDCYKRVDIELNHIGVWQPTDAPPFDLGLTKVRALIEELQSLEQAMLEANGIVENKLKNLLTETPKS